MLSLSPIKILIVLVVGMILLGPDKLPQVARQLGAAWRTFRSFHERVEREVRQTMPDLPSTADIARFARSPVALLNKLADHPAVAPNDPTAASAAGDGNGDGDGGAQATERSPQPTKVIPPYPAPPPGATNGSHAPEAPALVSLPDDPSLN